MRNPRRLGTLIVALTLLTNNCTSPDSDLDRTSYQLYGMLIAPEKQCPQDSISISLFKQPEADGCECGVIDCKKDAFLGTPKTRSLSHLKACLGGSAQCRIVFVEEDCASDEIKQNWQTVDDGRTCACGCDGVTQKPFSTTVGTLNTSSIITSCCK